MSPAAGRIRLGAYLWTGIETGVGRDPRWHNVRVSLEDNVITSSDDITLERRQMIAREQFSSPPRRPSPAAPVGDGRCSPPDTTSGSSVSAVISGHSPGNWRAEPPDQQISGPGPPLCPGGSRLFSPAVFLSRRRRLLLRASRNTGSDRIWLFVR